ncbi:hypothetical protein FIBSPDRAFT_960616 [Athelia psychrophila]|uniref:Uncharacterized protein n=1 Tax=Athelia psychrophila TaxID=1759441 RepID=A0A166C620_9AGAM|nr:hypothetical protein FIBSPDRAFT_960616 [Fibularhizoctonia sp. CBS 109695]
MCRVLQFCDRKEHWWKDQQGLRLLIEPHEKTLHEGLLAYSEKQMALERAIGQSWEAKWRGMQERAAPIIAGEIPGDAEDEDDYAGETEVIQFYYEDYDDAEDDTEHDVE